MAIDNAGKLRANQKQADKVDSILTGISNIEARADNTDLILNEISELKTRIDLTALLVILSVILMFACLILK